LLDSGAVVVAAGGGGIPVAMQADGTIVGVEAVVDKDLASSLLAHELGAQLLLIPTAVSRVAIDFGTPKEQWLESMSVAEARAHIAAGEFGAGSMEPKVAAVADFVASTPGAVGAIGAPEQIAQILDGSAGTRIEGEDAIDISSGADTPEQDAPAEGHVLLAVNGTLMRGLKLNKNMIAAGASFVRETNTAPAYRLWSINDDHPAMIRVPEGPGSAVHLEVWSVPAENVANILVGEPAGLSIGKVELADGSIVLGVLGEPALVQGQREITAHGGWRSYMQSKAKE
jgi:gamma-glutamylcyclotransferase (GGCT)/AIG2-like uncharacterized protein YtfP